MSCPSQLARIVSGHDTFAKKAEFTRHFKGRSGKRRLIVRFLHTQPTSPVSVRDMRFAEIRATFPRVSERSRGLRGMFFWIFARNQPISRASLWSPICSFRVLTPETRLECAGTGCSYPIASRVDQQGIPKSSRIPV